MVHGYCLKADIRQYFENIDHALLLSIIGKKLKDKNILFLIRKILSNYEGKYPKKGMPLGNLTSQFFANVYLNELDQFVKHTLKAKYYVRYVDDFVILHENKEQLEQYAREIGSFLHTHLAIGLHPAKSRIIPLSRGVDFLGFRIFYYHKLLRKSCFRRFKQKVTRLKVQLDQQAISYGVVYEILQGWCAYAKHADTHKLRRKLELQTEKLFPHQISGIELDRLLKDTGARSHAPALES